jgi:hypothetical protein
MKKLLFIFIGVAFLGSVRANVQDSIKSVIPIVPALNSADPNLVQYGQQYISSKVSNEILKSGLAGTAESESRFLLVITPTVIDKQNNNQLVMVKLSIQFSVVDVYEHITYSEMTTTVSGAGKSDIEASIDAFRRMNLTNSKLSEVIRSGRAKIMEYYVNKCSDIVNKANTLIKSKNHEEAIAILSSIPDLSNKTCKSAINSALSTAYLQLLDYKCQVAISQAKVVWSSSPNSEGAAEVSGLLSNLVVTDACKASLNGLISEIKARLISQEKREWDFKVATYKDTVNLQIATINAYRDISKSYYKSIRPTNYIYFVR